MGDFFCMRSAQPVPCIALHCVSSRNESMISRHLRSTAFSRLLLNGTAISQSRNVSNDTGKSKIYEFRDYSLKPDRAGEFLKLFETFYPARLKYGSNFGYWNVELGGLNKLFSIWEYDSFEHRANVRSALANNKEWTEGFVKEAFPCLQMQENSVMLLADWCDLQPDKTRSGAFELATYGMRIGGPKVWENKLKSSVVAHARLDYADLIGVWYTDIGDHNLVKVLWRYESFDGRREGRNKAHGDRVVVNKVRDNLENVRSHNSILMSHVPFMK